MAVLYIDLDRFKLLNESLGHEAADALLREVSRRLSQTSVRPTPSPACPATNSSCCSMPTAASAVWPTGSRLLQRIRKPIVIGEQELVISASIGVSLLPDNSRDAEVLLRQASTAMQQAKHRRQHPAVLHRPPAGIRHALPATGEPAAQGAGSRPAGSLLPTAPESGRRQPEAAEALVRWRHPQRGLVTPADFIPLAEETGLIIPLGEFVLREACRQARRWQQEGLADIRVSVNLSVKQLRQGNFVSLVRRAGRDQAAASDAGTGADRESAAGRHR